MPYPHCDIRPYQQRWGFPILSVADSEVCNNFRLQLSGGKQAAPDAGRLEQTVETAPMNMASRFRRAARRSAVLPLLRAALILAVLYFSLPTQAQSSDAALSTLALDSAATPAPPLDGPDEERGPLSALSLAVVGAALGVGLLWAWAYARRRSAALRKDEAPSTAGEDRAP